MKESCDKHARRFDQRVRPRMHLADGAGAAFMRREAQHGTRQPVTGRFFRRLVIHRVMFRANIDHTHKPFRLVHASHRFVAPQHRICAPQQNRARSPR